MVEAPWPEYNLRMLPELPCPCCRYRTILLLGSFEQCPICGWIDSGIYNDSSSVYLDEAQRNFLKFGACCSALRDAVSPPSQKQARAPSPLTLDAWRIGLKERFVDRAKRVFGAAPRPLRFTRHHCDECVEHDLELQPYDNDTLPARVVCNPLWSPSCFLTPQGFRYFAPGLVRLQIEDLGRDLREAHGWRSIDLLEFHLRQADQEQVSLFTLEEIRFIAELFDAVGACPGFESVFGLDSTISSSARAWRERADRVGAGVQRPLMPGSW